MAKHGANVKMKLLAAPKSYLGGRKEKYWEIAIKAGPRAKSEAISLGKAIRLTGFANTLKEIKFILNNREVHVNGKLRKSKNFPVGLFDVIEFPKIKKAFRVLQDNHGRLYLKEEKNPRSLLLRIVNKHYVKKNRVQITLNNGYNVLMEPEDGNKYKVGDTVLFDFVKKEIIAHNPLKEGAKVYIYKGNNVGKEGIIEEIRPGTMTMPKILVVRIENKVITLPWNYVYVVSS